MPIGDMVFDFLAGNIFLPDNDTMKLIQPFLTGIVVPLLTLGTNHIVIYSFKVNSLQSISNNFFKLKDNRKILDAVNRDTTNNSKVRDIKSMGKDFFDDIAEKIVNDYEEFNGKDVSGRLTLDLDEDLFQSASDKSVKELLVSMYDHYFHLDQSDLAHFIRNLFYIVRYFDTS